MTDQTAQLTAPAPGPYDIVFVLLLLQTAFGITAMLGTIVIAVAIGAGPALAGPLLLAAAGPVATLFLAIGVVRLRRWARNLTVAYEALILIGLAARLIIGGKLAFGLVPVLTGILLPAIVLVLLLNRPARRLVPKHRLIGPQLAEAINLPERRGRVAASPLSRRAAVGLILISAAIHLMILPAHAAEAPATAVLFASDVVLLLAASAGIFLHRRFRIGAAALLVANVVAYLIYTAGGREEVDQLGIATKVIELAAFGLLLIPRRPTIRARGSRRRKLRWATATLALLTLTTLTGAITWAVAVHAADADETTMTLGHDGESHHHHHHSGGLSGIYEQGDPNQTPTPEQQAAAAKLIADTRAGIAKYADIATALAAGYRPFGPDNGLMIHYTNHRYENDGVLLDPTRPETLVYASTPNGGHLLLGAMYSTKKSGSTGPAIGGPLTVWHVHTNVCLGPLPPFLAGVLSPFATCPFGSFNIVTGAMLHLWTIDWPGGPYGEMTDDDVKQIRKTL